MKRSFALLALAMLLGCGREMAVNSQLKASYERYLQIAPNNGHLSELVSVDWGDVPGTALGICDVKPQLYGNSRKIRIRPMDKFNQTVADVLVAHEMAHCLHDKKHNDQVIPSLMNTSFQGAEEFWQENLDAQIADLFK